MEQGVLSADKIPAALTIAKVNPDSLAWRSFLDRLLLWSGGLALAVSLLFFIAYNWIEMGRFAKFAIVQVCMAATIGAYWKLGTHTTAAKVALLMASIFLGVLLALYGQTYQTGADPWQLFFVWALLMLPWAIIARFSAIWVVWLVLLNISVILYSQTFGGLFWLLFDSVLETLWFVFGLNGLALIVWELLSNKWQWLAERWVTRLLAVASLAPLTWLVLYAIFDDKSGVASGLCWIAMMAGLYFSYRKLRQDLFVLAVVFLSGIVVAVALPSKHMMFDWNAGSFLFLTLLTVGLGAGAAFWLKNIQKEFQV